MSSAVGLIVGMLVLAGCGGTDCVSAVTGEEIDCEAGDAISEEAYEAEQEAQENVDDSVDQAFEEADAAQEELEQLEERQDEDSEELEDQFNADEFEDVKP